MKKREPTDLIDRFEQDAIADFEEPVPCGDCGRTVELQSTRPCRACRTLVCRRCLNDGLCERCGLIE